MKKVFIVTGIVFAILLAMFFAVVFWFWLMFGGASYFVHVPKPAVTYGEFPFKLTYEFHGNTKVIEDTIICEFDGFEVVGEAGKYRRWKAHLKSGKEYITLFDARKLIAEKDYEGNKILELYFDWGNAEYYMGDTMRHACGAQSLDEVCYLYRAKEKRTIGHSVVGAKMALEKYKIELISWEVAPPIENTFN